MYRRLRFGLPKGYLNKRDANKGYTGFLLKLAGFKMEGYKPDREVQMPIAEGERDIEFYCMKPKQMPSLLEEKAIDVAILGEDTLEERYSAMWQDLFGYLLEGEGDLWEDETPEWAGQRVQELWTELRGRIKQIYSANFDPRERCKVSGGLPYDLSDLGYGCVKICWGAKDGRNEEKMNSLSQMLKEGQGMKSAISRLDNLRIASAYPNITYGEMLKRLYPMDGIRMATNFSYDKEASVTFVVRGRYKPKVVIYPLASNTEMTIKLGLADLIMDSVVSGESFKRNNLKIVGEPVSQSTVHLYARDDLGKAYGEFKKGAAGSDTSDGINLKRFDEIVQRLTDASKVYGLTREDSVHYNPGDHKNE